MHEIQRQGMWPGAGEPEQLRNDDLRSALLGHLSRMPTPETRDIAQAAEIIRGFHYEWPDGMEEDTETLANLARKISNSTTVLAEMFVVDEASLPASWKATPEDARTVLAASAHIELGYLQAQRISQEHGSGNPCIDERIREVTRFVGELQPTPAAEETLPQQPKTKSENDKSQGYANEPRAVINDYLDKVGHPSQGMIYDVERLIKESCLQAGERTDAFDVCIEISARFPTYLTLVLAEMFATNFKIIPEDWRENPEITRTVLSMSGYIEAGQLRSRQLRPDHFWSNTGINANIEKVSWLTEALQQK